MGLCPVVNGNPLGIEPTLSIEGSIDVSRHQTFCTYTTIILMSGASCNPNFLRGTAKKPCPRKTHIGIFHKHLILQCLVALY